MSSPGSLLNRSNLDLEEVPFARLLGAVARERRTLVARMRSGLVDKTVVFEAGVPVDCRSNMVQDTLSRFMVRQGRITRDQENQLLQKSTREGKLFGEVVHELGLATSEEIYRILQQNLAKKLLDLFTWEEGAAQLLPDVPTVESPLKVNVAQLVLTGCTRFVPKPEVDLGVGHLVGQRVVLHPAPVLDPGSLRVTAAQGRVLEALREPAGLSDLTAASELSFEDTTRFVYALIALELVVPEEEAARAPAVPATPKLPEIAPEVVEVLSEAAEPAVEATPEPAPAADVEEAMDLARRAEDVMTTYLRHRRVDARGLLGLLPTAPKSELKEQFLQFSRRFAPWRYEDPRLLSLADKAEELFFAGIRAYGQLSGDADAAGDVATDHESAEAGAPTRPVSSGQMIRRAADELTSNVPELLDPEVHFEEGLAARKAGELTKALNALELAVKCDPQNGTYRAEAAWTFYERSPGTGAEKARQQLDKALRGDPGCGLALFYYGELSRLLGEYDTAEEYLRKSIKPMAPDRRPIDKLRDLQKIRKQQES